MNPITKEYLLSLIEKLRRIYQESDLESIPLYTEEELDNLLGCIERIYSSGYYTTAQERICSVIFNVTKGHFLSNGNKRVASIITAVSYSHEFKDSDLNIIILLDAVLKVASNEFNKDDILRLIHQGALDL